MILSTLAYFFWKIRKITRTALVLWLLIPLIVLFMHEKAEIKIELFENFYYYYFLSVGVILGMFFTKTTRYIGAILLGDRFYYMMGSTEFNEQGKAVDGVFIKGNNFHERRVGDLRKRFKEAGMQPSVEKDHPYPEGYPMRNVFMSMYRTIFLNGRNKPSHTIHGTGTNNHEYKTEEDEF